MCGVALLVSAGGLVPAGEVRKYEATWGIRV
jgi:hypothetical protein